MIILNPSTTNCPGAMGPMPTPAQTTVTGSPGHGQLARENLYTKQCTERRFMAAQVGQDLKGP